MTHSDFGILMNSTARLFELAPPYWPTSLILRPKDEYCFQEVFLGSGRTKTELIVFMMPSYYPVDRLDGCSLDNSALTTWAENKYA